MLKPIKLEFDIQANRNKIDRTVKYLTIKSRDINTILFEIAFKGITLDETYTVGLLAVFGNGNQANYDLEIKEGKALYKPDVSLITQCDTVKNYVYLQQGNKSLDVRQFNHQVELSELDKRAGVTRKVYDQNYSNLITEFEHSLNEYKENLPQGSELRSEVDAILDKFGMDSQAKLSQYDDDAQQVIADNQTAFGLAESGRQATYEQAEGSRNQASEQAVSDWEQSADAIINIVEDNETARVDAETTRKTAETDRVSSETTRKSNETTRVSNESERESAEVIRIANEADRVNAENIRSEFYEGFDDELEKKANKKQEEWLYPTITNGAADEARTPCFFKDEFSVVHLSGRVSGIVGTRQTLFTLPTGYRPYAGQGFPCITGGGNFGYMSINNAGAVSMITGNTLYMSLDGITFRAER